MSAQPTTSNQTAKPRKPRKSRAKPPELRQKTGRKSDFQESYIDQAYKLCLLRATDAEIADIFRIHISNLERWKQRYPAFREAFSRGREQADANVAKSLYMRAVGYEKPAVKVFLRPGDQEPIYAPYTEHVPPDVLAAGLWLRNRHHDKWRDRVDVSASVKMTAQIVDFRSMSDEELEAIVAFAEASQRRLEVERKTIEHQPQDEKKS